MRICLRFMMLNRFYKLFIYQIKRLNLSSVMEYYYFILSLYYINIKRANVCLRFSVIQTYNDLDLMGVGYMYINNLLDKIIMELYEFILHDFLRNFGI